ncbi:MAG: hypothetical protein ABL933_15710 [Methyloglobulus sp.]
MTYKFDLDIIEDVFRDYYPTLGFSQSFNNSIIENFEQHFMDGTLARFMEIACDRTEDSHSAIKYFCGICWTRIKQNQTDYGNLQAKDSPKNKQENKTTSTLH